MGPLFWHLTNQTAESLLILNLFHLLLAGLALLVMLHQLRGEQGADDRAGRLLALGLGSLVLHFALLTLQFGVQFFFRQPLGLVGLERLAHGLLVGSTLILAAAYLDAGGLRPVRILPGFGILVVLVVLDLSTGFASFSSTGRPHSLYMVLGDVLAIVSIVVAILALRANPAEWAGRRMRRVALVALGGVFLLHACSPLFSGAFSGLAWNLEEHLLSVTLFAFTWAAAERTGDLLERVFVRLNLTFIVLASLIMLTTAQTAKYQYMRLTEERSMDLAEFLRGHVTYYHAKGENLEEIFAHPEVLKRVVGEFGRLSELREVDIYLDGKRAGFRYTPDREVQESIGAASASDRKEPANGFRMIRLPIEEGAKPDNRVEFIGTMEFVNDYIARYIVLIYCSFTVVVILASVVIGIIVRDAERQLRRQYTELQEAQQHLAQSAKLASIGELAGGMAHEINNPITSILALSSHMVTSENDGALSPRGRKNLQVIAQQAERVANLVSGLLTFSRQSQLRMSQVNVCRLLENALDLIQYRLKDGSIVTHREIEPHLPALAGDESRLTEVFVNLIANAIDAMPSGGTLGVRAHRNSEDGGVRIEVRDTGEGISEENLMRIFDPFFTTKVPGRGTGLGLSISHGIVKDHGGQIWAESERGMGTVMTVILPAGANVYEAAHSGD